MLLVAGTTWLVASTPVLAAAVSQVLPAERLSWATGAAAFGGGAILVATVWLAFRQARANRALTRALAEAQATREALAAAEARLRRVQRIGRVGGFEIDLRTGVNRRDAEYMGLQGLREAAAEERHEDWVRRLHPADRARAERRFLEAVADGAPDTEYAQEYRIVTPAGEVRWIAARAEIERDPQGRALRMLGAHVDITELKAAEAALRENDARFRSFAEHAPQTIYIIDVVQRRLEYLSPAFERMWGGAREVLMRDLRRWRDFVHPQDVERVLALHRRLYHQREPVEGEYRILRPSDGELRHIRDTAVPILAEDGTVARAIGIAQDITPYRRAEAAMRASDERLALASAAAGLGVWDLDLRTKVGVVNAEYRALYGLPPEEGPLRNAEWLACVHPEDRARMQAASLAAQAGLAPYDEECRIIRADTGEMRWIATRGSLVRGDVASGRMVGISYDVTERRREQERQMLLAREVDHRAKNVLAVVQSIVRLTRASDPRSFAQAVEGRVAALARAHTLLSRDRWTGASLAEVVREELLAYGGGGRILLEGPELWLKPDAVQSLSMVLHELATNAAKYGALSRPGGQVSVEWRLEPRERLRLDWTERGGPPVLAPPERRGFGSTVITATMRSHLEGEATMIWAAEGLRCEITAPADRTLAAVPGEDAAEAEAEPASAPAEALDAQTLEGRRVLVVEDEPLLALEIAATLQALGCEIVGPASSLAEALRLGHAEAARLDAAVMDVNLRGQASFPIADLMARHGVAVIFVSGYGALPGAHADAAGLAPTLLRKPLREGDLAPALRLALARRAEAAALSEAPRAGPARDVRPTSDGHCG